MNYRMFSLSSMALAVASVLTIAPAFAQPPAQKAVAPLPKAASNDVAIPPCLEKVALSQQQQDQIKQIVRDYDDGCRVGVEAVRRPLSGNGPHRSHAADRH